MTTIQNRFSLSSLFLIGVAFAAYHAGRLKEDQYVRATTIAEADAASLRERSIELEQLSRTWKNIALQRWPAGDAARSRSRHWTLSTSTIRASDYPDKLDSLGIKILTISGGRQLHVMTNFSTHPEITAIDSVPACGGIVQGGHREQELVDRAGFREMPADILLLLPQALVDTLEAEELTRARRMGLQLSQIEETSFDLVQQYSKDAAPAIVRSIRPSRKAVAADDGPDLKQPRHQ